MKNLLSTALFGIIFLGLAALAFLSAPRGAAEVAASVAPSDNSAVVAGAAPSLASAAENFNLIALPLHAQAAISPYTASGLIAYHPGTTRVFRFNSATQTYSSFGAGDPPPLDFPLETGGAYFFSNDTASANVFTVVGDVPDMGEISNTLTPGDAGGCFFNSISIPLDQGAVASASDLLTAISGSSRIFNWNAGTQSYNSFGAGDPPPLDFPVSIGYPYFVCVDLGGATQWP